MLLHSSIDEEFHHSFGKNHNFFILPHLKSLLLYKAISEPLQHISNLFCLECY